MKGEQAQWNQERIECNESSITFGNNTFWLDVPGGCYCIYCNSRLKHSEPQIYHDHCHCRPHGYYTDSQSVSTSLHNSNDIWGKTGAHCHHKTDRGHKISYGQNAKGKIPQLKYHKDKKAVYCTFYNAINAEAK